MRCKMKLLILFKGKWLNLLQYFIAVELKYLNRVEEIIHDVNWKQWNKIKDHDWFDHDKKKTCKLLSLFQEFQDQDEGFQLRASLANINKVFNWEVINKLNIKGKIRNIQTSNCYNIVKSWA